MGYSVEEVRRSMPNVGDHHNGGTVDYVNKDKLWYRVKMPDGTNESYKITQPIFHPNQAMIYKYRVVETNKLYCSLAQCANDLGCAKSSVLYSIDKGRKLLQKYTVERLE